jgi:hypothetical protein
MKHRIRPAKLGRSCYEHLFLIDGRGRSYRADGGNPPGPCVPPGLSPADGGPGAPNALRCFFYGPHQVWARIVAKDSSR